MNVSILIVKLGYEIWFGGIDYVKVDMWCRIIGMGICFGGIDLSDD